MFHSQAPAIPLNVEGLQGGPEGYQGSRELQALFNHCDELVQQPASGCSEVLREIDDDSAQHLEPDSSQKEDGPGNDEPAAQQGVYAPGEHQKNHTRDERKRNTDDEPTEREWQG